MIPKQTVNMRDVAARLGVSISTVSRALRGLPGVSESTRERVLHEAEQMSYVVSPAAATLAAGVTGRIGVLVPRVDGWFYSTVIAGAEERLRAAGLDTVLCCLPTPRERFDFVERLPLRRKVDGVIVVSYPLDTRSEARLNAMGIPVVVVGTPSNTFPFVGIDDRRAARQAVDHLVRAGHRRIGMIRAIDPDGVAWASDLRRLEGYRAALAAAGIAEDPELTAEVPWGIDGGAHGMEMLLSIAEPPGAVFCFSDEVAIGALRTLRRAGLPVPEAVSVTAVDDHPMSELVDLTTVRQPVREQGERAAELVVDLLAGRAVGDVQLPTRLIVRQSTRAVRPAPQERSLRSDRQTGAR